MTIKTYPRVFALAVLLTTPVLAQVSITSGQRQPDQAQQAERALNRCKQNRGVDCDTPEGQKEWLLQERSREEALRQGSRHLGSSPSGATPSRR